jgi:hypothetical protein
MPLKITGGRVTAEDAKRGGIFQAIKEGTRDAISGAFDTPGRPPDANPTVTAGLGAPRDTVQQGVEAIKAKRQKGPALPDPESWK